MRLLRIAVAMAAVISLSACTSVAQFAANTAASLSSQTPTQVTTLADAVSAATLVAQTADVAVNTGKLTRAQLLEVQALSNAVNAALTQLETSQSAGQSLTYDSFNAALAAYTAYATSQGIST